MGVLQYFADRSSIILRIFKEKLLGQLVTPEGNSGLQELKVYTDSFINATNWFQ